MSEPNILWKTKTYLVGHMEGVSHAEGSSWREKTTKFLNKMGVVVFDPYKKPFLSDFHDEGPEAKKKLILDRTLGHYDDVSAYMRRVRIFDLNLVDRSDFIIANIKPNTASWGSTEEVVTATRMKKPIYLCVEGGKKECPLWIFGMFPHKYIFDSLDEVLEELTQIDNGTIQPDGRWRLLKQEYR